ncbi:MAG: TonB-dependent receptor [FCB group bacterium]|nr:TonB-dependent receptor [FCB group bacterium]
MDMSMAGLGLSGEGPTFGGRGSYLISFRKSYLDLIIRQTGLVAIPRYWNTQMKFTYDINPVNKLMFNITHGVDAIDIEGENDASSRGAENVVSRGNQTIFGVTYKRLWKNEGITRFTFGGTRARFKYDVYRYLADGEKDQYYRQDELEWDLQFKTDFVWRLSRHLEISAGMDLKEIGRDFDAYADADTLWQYGYLYPGSSDSYQIVDQSTWFTEIYPIVSSAEGDSVYLDSQDVWHYSATDPQGNWQSVLVQKLDTVRVDEDWSTLKKDSFPRIGAFAQVKWHPMIQLTITAGLRYGYFQITDFSWLSPRLGLSYHFSDKTSLNAGYGHHYQSPSVLLLSYDPVNESLKNKDSEQLVLGLEHFFAKDTRGTLEIYRKRTRNKPIPLSATTVDSSDYSTEFVNKGENQSSGVELFLQKKLARDLFGTFSYSYYRSEDRDPRYPDQDLYYPAAFDYKNVLTLIGGYKLQMKGNNTRPLSERNPMIRFVGKYVGLGADELELSFRYRYVGGKPYTPLSYDHNTRRWFESQGGDRNTHRFAEYHRLDIMILWHSQIFGKNLISYIDIMNIFNRPNIWDLQRNPDGTVDDILQFQTFPVGGFILEF